MSNLSKDPTQILVDFNNLMIIALFGRSVDAQGDNFNKDLWWYNMFDRIHSLIVQVAVAHKAPVQVFLPGDLKIPSWRAEIYPPYKGNRPPLAGVDMEMVKEEVANFKALIAHFLPWKQITVPRAEADDIIAVLVQKAEARGQRSVVYSTDCDYLQLHSELTQIYSPQLMDFVVFPSTVTIAGKKILCPDPEHFLALSVLTGQGCKDNVYNIKTDTDWAPGPEKKRKPPFGPVAAAKALNAPEGTDKYIEKLGCTKNYERNSLLIDFKQIPQDIEDLILGEVAALPALNNDLDGLVEMMNWNNYDKELLTFGELYKEVILT